jgi:hypothetical protein
MTLDDHITWLPGVYRHAQSIADDRWHSTRPGQVQHQ